MDSELRKKVLKHPERYPPEYLKRAGASSDEEERQKMLREYRNSLATVEEVEKILTRYHATRVVPPMKALRGELNEKLYVPLHVRGWRKLRAWWEERGGEGG